MKCIAIVLALATAAAAQSGWGELGFGLGASSGWGEPQSTGAYAQYTSTESAATYVPPPESVTLLTAPTAPGSASPTGVKPPYAGNGTAPIGTAGPTGTVGTVKPSGTGVAPPAGPTYTGAAAQVGGSLLAVVAAGVVALA